MLRCEYQWECYVVCCVRVVLCLGTGEMCCVAWLGERERERERERECLCVFMCPIKTFTYKLVSSLLFHKREHLSYLSLATKLPSLNLGDVVLGSVSVEGSVM